MATVAFRHKSHHNHDQDAALLDILTSPNPKAILTRRDSELDPLLLAAASASGPHVTRNHYHHDFFPGVMLPQAEGAWDWTKWTGEESAASKQHLQGKRRLTYVSRQAPRRVRLQGLIPEDSKENALSRELDPLKRTDNLPPSSPKNRRLSLVSPIATSIAPDVPKLATPVIKGASALVVKCMARTRVPTPHGFVFLHLYQNNRDAKEHLAIVVDPAQFEEGTSLAPPIRSHSLDAVWSENETEMDRITRGAYVGRLSAATHRASKPTSHTQPAAVNADIPSPLIRIHSECFTGETIGSMRCDCGEQLDEAIRIISRPITLPTSSAGSVQPTTIPGRGAVIYLRQEGRGIGLLSKIQAYNLQDLGHDTVTANLMLGHQADERGYEIAGAILRDLGLGSAADSDLGKGVRLLTNNPDKVRALEAEGLRIVERVPMVPRSWQGRQPAKLASVPIQPKVVSPMQKDEDEDMEKVAGATLIGGGAVYGEDLDKYLRTKVLRMGHMLPLWLEPEL